MRLKEFEGKLLRLHIPSWAGIVKAEKVYWLGGRVISIWYHSNGTRGTGKIFLSFGAGQSIKVVREELQNFIEEEKC